MFCAGCGTQIQSGLNYCSRCGRRVAEEAKSGIGNNPKLIAAYTAGVGFICYVLVLRMLTKGGFPPDMVLPVTFFYFVALFGICFMLARQPGASADTPTTRERLPVNAPAYLHPVTTAQLHEGFREPASVTDHTTRTLDKVRVEKP